MSDANDFGSRFIDALGGDGWDKTGAWFQSLWGGNSHVRDMLESKEPNEILAAFKEADPRLSTLVEIARNDPKLAEALKNALVKDDSVLTGLGKMAEGEGEGIFDKDLINKLNDPAMGGILRGQITAALNKVADDDKVGFEHLQNLLKQGKDLAKLGDMFKLMQKDPDAFITQLLADIEDPQLKAMMAGAMSFIMPLIQAFTDPNGFMLKPYTEFAQHYGLTNPSKIMADMGARGAEVLANGATEPVEPPAGSTPKKTAEAADIPKTQDVASGADDPLWDNTDDGTGSGYVETASLAGDALLGTPLRGSYNPNASGARTDGYKDDPAPTETLVANAKLSNIMGAHIG